MVACTLTQKYETKKQFEKKPRIDFRNYNRNQQSKLFEIVAPILISIQENRRKKNGKKN